MQISIKNLLVWSFGVVFVAGFIRMGESVRMDSIYLNKSVQKTINHAITNAPLKKGQEAFFDYSIYNTKNEYTIEYANLQSDKYSMLCENILSVFIKRKDLSNETISIIGNNELITLKISEQEKDNFSDVNRRKLSNICEEINPQSSISISFEK